VIPFYEQFQWPADPLFGRLAIRGFGLMVVLGILVGYRVLQNRARMRELDVEDVSDFVFFTVVIGFLGAHVFDVLFYYPEKLRADPWVLIKFWDGISSYGGFITGLFGSWLFFQLRGKLKPYLWDFLDCLGYAWPFAFWITRVGCFLAHDHPGTRTKFFLAVNFPANWGGIGQGGPRHDLGLYEALYVLLVICTTFFVLNRRKPDRSPGFYVGLFLVLYAPVRFSLDFLRVADATYAGLTPAQYTSMLALVFGSWILIARPGDKPRPVEPQPEPADKPKPAKKNKKNKKKKKKK